MVQKDEPDTESAQAEGSGISSNQTEKAAGSNRQAVVPDRTIADPGTSAPEQSDAPDATATAGTVEVDDATLVNLAQQGQFDAFDQLVSRHEQRVYNTARRILRHDQDAEDAMQTTFLSAMQHLDQFRGEASFATWITRIAANTALKILRKRGRSVDFSSAQDPRVSMNDMPAMDQRLADLGPDLLERVEQRELGRILDAAADALDDKHRVVFVLRDMEGLSVKETAEQLSISESNVKIRLMRARLKLRQWLCAQLHDCAEL